MSTTNISVSIEPVEGTSVVYEPVARKNINGELNGIVCLQLRSRTRAALRFI
jgi:hypothetical protein